MNIAVIGNGNVGGTLGRRWAEVGHDVVFGVRGPESNAGPVKAQSVKEAVAGADVVVFALPYSAIVEAATGLDLSGKVLVDCTNPIAPDFSGPAAKAGSASEELAKATGSNLVVKAFNTCGYEVMADPNFRGRKATMLICGNDAGAKETVAKLAADLGFEPADAGPLSQARWLEAFAWVWISMSMKYGHGRSMAFLLEKR
ncbi:MAG TPA: NADPH-dependent F420 reductase [Fimbriimonadaceae bacterium]|nr:NADPH-dependent F420 reductase [Fimbriimonadaceae bacterium]